jgi:hypothetical protein
MFARCIAMNLGILLLFLAPATYAARFQVWKYRQCSHCLSVYYRVPATSVQVIARLTRAELVIPGGFSAGAPRHGHPNRRGIDLVKHLWHLKVGYDWSRRRPILACDSRGRLRIFRPTGCSRDLSFLRYYPEAVALADIPMRPEADVMRYVVALRGGYVYIFLCQGTFAACERILRGYGLVNHVYTDGGSVVPKTVAKPSDICIV